VAIGTEQTVTKAPREKGKTHLKSVALRAYSRNQTQVSDERIIQFLPMVRKIARRAVAYIKPPMTVDDLISAGTVGLVKAARDYDPFRNAEFETYAYIRVKGAILDELRSSCLLPPGMKKQIQTAAEMSRKITEDTGSTPTESQLAEALGISVDQLYKTFEAARLQHFVSIDESGDDMPALGLSLPSTDAATPEEQLEKAELLDKLAAAIEQLPPRQRQIILLYYQQQLTMKQIAEVFGITESRVSQLHAAALFNLSVKLGDGKNDRR